MSTQMSRQEFRRQRLLELTQEQHLEDIEGLFMTQEQRELLLSSFISVKLEFHDLDGLQWTQTALRKRQGSRTTSVLPHHHHHATQDYYPFAVVTSTDYDAEATIRASVPSSMTKKRNKRRPLSITSKSFWVGENDTLTSSFPLPPSSSHFSSLPVPPSSREPHRRVLC